MDAVAFILKMPLLSLGDFVGTAIHQCSLFRHDSLGCVYDTTPVMYSNALIFISLVLFLKNRFLFYLGSVLFFNLCFWQWLLAIPLCL